MSKELPLRNFVYKSEIDAPVGTLFAWHFRQRAFERLSPPWVGSPVRGVAPTLKQGIEVPITVRKFGLDFDCTFKVIEFESDKKFVDVQVKGPFAHWRHDHIFEALEDRRSIMEDKISFSMPLGFISEPLFAGQVLNDLQRYFRYRHEVLQNELRGYLKNCLRPRHRVLIFDSQSALSEPLFNYLATQGHEVVLFPQTTKDQFVIERQLAERIVKGEFTAFVCLSPFCKAGQWEIDTRRTMLHALAKARLKNQTPVYLDVHMPHLGNCYCQAWEQHCEISAPESLRCVFAHSANVLTPEFGILKTAPEWASVAMRKHDSQSLSTWIAVDDAVAAIEHCLFEESISGRIEFVAPHAVKQKDNELKKTGYEFRYERVEEALKHLLGIELEQ